MILGFPYLYHHYDRSKLFRAWESYYDGLSYTKKAEKVYERVRKGKMPTKKHFTTNKQNKVIMKKYYDGLATLGGGEQPVKTDEKDKLLIQSPDQLIKMGEMTNAWLEQRQLCQEKDQEIERLKRLIEKAHTAGWNDHAGHITFWETSWKLFNQENNL